MNNFTIIIPIYNESDSIFALVREIKKEFWENYLRLLLLMMAVQIILF